MSDAPTPGPWRGRPAPDVIVVGGGVAGSSTAYRLAEDGQRVLLLERRGLASGASGRNGGITGSGSALYAHSDVGRAVYALTSRNLEMLKHLTEETGSDIALQMTGAIDIVTTSEELAHLQAAVPTERAAGVGIELLDGQQAREAVPALAPDVLGAAYVTDRGQLWPFAVVHAFGDAARRHGAEIRTGVAVERLLRDGDRVVGVVADGEAIPAGNVVLATNAYTPTLLPDLPQGAIVPARGQILVTQPVPPILPTAFGTNFEKEYGRQASTGQILCGGFRRDDANEGLGTYEERVTPSVIAGIAGCLTRLFPALARGGIRVVRTWAGIMGFTADGLPLIGPYDPAPGLWLAAGFNGGGFSWGAVVGRVTADLVAGRDPGFDLAPFRPGRFHDGGTVWANPFTAGERNNPDGIDALAHA